MRIAILFLALASGACAAPILVANTPEGRACIRECMLVRNTCFQEAFACNMQHRRCLKTCPPPEREDEP